MRPLVILLGTILCTGLTAQSERHQLSSEAKPSGYVPDEAAAIRIAEKKLIQIYGRRQIDRERPLQARNDDGVWIVHGTLPKDMVCGVAHVKIRQRDGHILEVWHTK